MSDKVDLLTLIKGKTLRKRGNDFQSIAQSTNIPVRVLKKFIY